MGEYNYIRGSPQAIVRRWTVRSRKGRKTSSRLLNELRLRRDIARPDNQVGKLGSSPAQINNNLATLSDSELTWIWFDAS